MTNYLALEIVEIHTLLKNKKITPLMLVEEAFAKIEESSLNAFISLNKEEAVQIAKRLENKEPDNLLFGIPIAIKDNIMTKGLRTTCASRMLEDFTPIYDATVIQKIKEKNMIVIGKTNMDEFAMGSTGETSYFGPIKNPWNGSKVPGGSSSGSAAAVSSRIVPLSLGTDTGGSIRQPASFCGLVGLKPTYGRVSRYGVASFASSLDQVGILSKNVYENALLLHVIGGEDSSDCTSSSIEVDDYTKAIGEDVKGLKIAVPNYYMSEVIVEEVRSKVKEVEEILIKKGCTVDYIDIPYLEYSIPLYQTIALGEASSNLARYDGIRYGHCTQEYTDIESLYKNSRSEGFGREVKRRIMIGSYVLSGENAHLYFDKAMKVRHAMTKSIAAIFDTYDLIVGPTNTDVAYDLGIKKDDALKAFYDDLLTNPVNMTGLPAMSLPIGFTHDHMPVGMHIIGNYFDEKTIYKLASFIEKELVLDLNPGGEDAC